MVMEIVTQRVVRRNDAVKGTLMTAVAREEALAYAAQHAEEQRAAEQQQKQQQTTAQQQQQAAPANEDEAAAAVVAQVQTPPTDAFTMVKNETISVSELSENFKKNRGLVEDSEVPVGYDRLSEQLEHLETKLQEYASVVNEVTETRNNTQNSDIISERERLDEMTSISDMEIKWDSSERGAFVRNEVIGKFSHLIQISCGIFTSSLDIAQTKVSELKKLKIFKDIQKISDSVDTKATFLLKDGITIDDVTNLSLIDILNVDDSVYPVPIDPQDGNGKYFVRLGKYNLDVYNTYSNLLIKLMACVGQTPQSVLKRLNPTFTESEAPEEQLSGTCKDIKRIVGNCSQKKIVEDGQKICGNYGFKTQDSSTLGLCRNPSSITKGNLCSDKNAYFPRNITYCN